MPWCECAHCGMDLDAKPIFPSLAFIFCSEDHREKGAQVYYPDCDCPVCRKETERRVSESK